MGRYVIRRLALLVLVVWGVVTATFLLIHAAPGDPARAYLGHEASPAALQALRHEWGMDRSLIVQYFGFLKDVAHGDLGSSLAFGAPNTELIMERLPTTLLLMLMTTLMAVAISLPLACWVAMRGRGKVDGAVRIGMAVTQGTPSVLVGTFLIIILALKLGLFPVGGYGDTWPEHLYSLVLPSLTMAIYITPMLVNSLRSALREALASEYVGFAKAKGLATSTVVSRYAIRNGSIAGLSILGVQAGGLVGTALVVENVFAVPGMGTMMMTGILNRDFAAVQAATLVLACVVVLVYLLNDLLYAAIDPRVTLQ